MRSRKNSFSNSFFFFEFTYKEAPLLLRDTIFSKYRKCQGTSHGLIDNNKEELKGKLDLTTKYSNQIGGGTLTNRILQHGIGIGRPYIVQFSFLPPWVDVKKSYSIPNNTVSVIGGIPPALRSFGRETSLQAEQ